MKRRYFGTDGIRGQSNTFPMTPDLAMRVGIAVGTIFRRGAHRHRVVIGKDTRLSGYMLENAMVAGFTAAGIDAFVLGPIPTPAVAMPTTRARGIRPWRDAAPSAARISAQAPSFTPDALPAVTVPSGLTTPFNLASASRLVSRGCSSAVTTTASPFFCATVTGQISASKKPAFAVWVCSQ